MSFYKCKLKLLHEVKRRITSVKLKRYYAAAAIRHIFLHEVIIFIRLKSGIADLLYLRIPCKQLSDRHAVFHMALHAHMKRFETEIEKIRILRRLYAAQIPHKRCGTFGNKSALKTESFCKCNTVIRIIRRRKPRELIRMCQPVERTAVHHGSAHGHRMSIHVLGGGVCDDIRAPFEGAAVDGCGKGVVDNERHTVRMRSIREKLGIVLDGRTLPAWLRDQFKSCES